MSTIPKEIIRDLIRTEKPHSTQEVLNLLKGMFKDVLQGALEAELDDHLGYEKNDKTAKQTNNHRNGYFAKTVKSELGPHRAANPA